MDMGLVKRLRVCLWLVHTRGQGQGTLSPLVTVDLGLERDWGK